MHAMPNVFKIKIKSKKFSQEQFAIERKEHFALLKRTNIAH